MRSSGGGQGIGGQEREWGYKRWENKQKVLKTQTKREKK